jgi:Flp pilus assembly protein TadD
MVGGGNAGMGVSKLIGRLRDAWQEALELNRKKEVWRTIRRGRQLIVEGDVDEMLHFLSLAVYRFPDNAELRFLYASALEDVRPDDAASEAMKAVELEPDDPSLLTRIAYIMSGVNRPDIARRYAASARELGGADFLFAPELHHLESRFALQDGDQEVAEEGFRISVEREPQSEMFAVDLARLLANQGRRQEAIRVIDKAMKCAKTQDRLRFLLLEFVDQENGSS